MDVRTFTVGPVAENSYILRRERSDRALIVDPEHGFVDHPRHPR